MLRPMLKEWLDEHLPEIVEELVTREIARITGPREPFDCSIAPSLRMVRYRAALMLGRRLHEQAPAREPRRARSRPAPAASARPITATDLATMRRLAAPAVSPDGHWAVYQLSETDLAANRRRTDLFLLDLAHPGAEPVQIASHARA